MSLNRKSKRNKNNILGVFLAAGLGFLLGANPTSATSAWQAGSQLGLAGQASASASVAEAAQPGGKVARAFTGGRQSIWTGLMGKPRRVGRDLNPSSRRGVARAFAGGSRKSHLASLRSGPGDSAKTAGTGCGGVVLALTGRVGLVGERRCDGASD